MKHVSLFLVRVVFCFFSSPQYLRDQTSLLFVSFCVMYFPKHLLSSFQYPYVLGSVSCECLLQIACSRIFIQSDSLCILSTKYLVHFHLLNYSTFEFILSSICPPVLYLFFSPFSLGLGFSGLIFSFYFPGMNIINCSSILLVYPGNDKLPS